VLSASTSATNWNDTTTYARVYKLTTSGGQVTVIEDHRAGPAGIHAGVQIPAPIAWRAETDSTTLVLGDAENGVSISKATAVNLTVPPFSSVAFPVGTSILIAQEGAGQITIVEGSGVTVNYAAAYTLKLSEQYSLATLVNRSTNVWLLVGDLEPV
jgi:hypothetical protein